MTVVVGWLVQKCEQGRWVWATNAEPSCSGSFSGLPSQTAVESDGGRCWGGSYDTTTIAAQRIRKCEVGEGVGGPKNPKPSTMAWFRAVSGYSAVEGGSVSTHGFNHNPTST